MFPEIDLRYMKNLVLYSALTGILCAVLSLFHMLMPAITLFFMPFLGVLIPFYILIFKDKFYSPQNKTYLILGGISGLVICILFFIVFIPAVYICNLINKNYYDYGVKYLNPFLFILFFVMAAVILICTNATAGLFFGIIYNFIKSKKTNG